MEADDVLVLDKAFAEPHFRLRDPDAIKALEPENVRDPKALGRAFAVAWIEKATVQERATVLERKARGIPPEIDRFLLAYAARSLGISRVDDDFRKELRQGFWDAAAELAK